MTLIRRALVTGSSSGIGEAAAKLLGAKGVAVAVHGRREQEVRRVVTEIETGGGRAVAILGDLATEEMATAIAQNASDALGGLDLVVNNAALLTFGGLEEVSIAEIRRVFDVNVFAVMAITRAVLPQMRQRGHGRIINISSIVGWLPFPFVGAYATSKHAIEGYSKTLDHEVRKLGIRVVTVQPGYTRTKININSDVVATSIPEYEAARRRVQELIAAKIEHGELPERVARVIWRAATSQSPRSTYRVGPGPTAIRALQTILPGPIFDVGLRWHFRLDE